MTSTYAAARTTRKMVNREKELQALQDAFCLPNNDTRVVIIEGEGGLGKTRLLSEALWLSGHPDIYPARKRIRKREAWGITGSVIVSDLLDFTEANLHTYENFMQRFRNALTWHEAVEFPNYDAEVGEYKRQLRIQSNYFAVQKAAKSARDAFFEDYRELAEKYRIVWALDTAEQLEHPGSAWLLEQGLLTYDDLNFGTQQRLLELLKDKKLPNTTVVLVGRPTARKFFDQIIDLAEANPDLFSVNQIKLVEFLEDDVKTYLNYLSEDYVHQPGADEYVAAYLSEFADDDDRIKVLRLYTGGQPVRLALFVDILAEGKNEPEALQDTFIETKKRLKWNEGTDQPDLNSLAVVQSEIEKEFIRLMFAQQTDIRSRILTALVRARRGLDVDRLVYILSHRSDSIDTESEDQKAVRKKIQRELNRKDPHSIRWLSFVKERGDGKLILQDELYRIYDRHVSADPVTREDETRDRRQLYQHLQAFTEEKLNELKQQRTLQRVEDLESLSFPSPAQALVEQARFLGEDDEESGRLLAEGILEVELERLHYLLRVNPDAGFNDKFNDLANQRWLANNEEADVQIQIELWRFLRDEFAQTFVDQQVRESKVANTTPMATLERAAVQADIAGWLKRFWLRGKYERTISFADKVEEIIEAMPNEPKESRDLQITLSHTFSREERRNWKIYSQIYLGKNIPEAIKILEGTDEHEGSVETMIRLLRDGISKKQEKSFLGHPGEIRLQRLIGITYNTIGYGYAMQGLYRKASVAYATALRYLRDTEFKTQKAVVRNNLSRALSELGLITRSIRICEDGLEIKKEIGGEKEIAVSYSTLALIYNNALQPENAWVEAAKAIAYFRKLDNMRGLGLALFHLAEALRRLAVSKKPKQNSPKQLFNTALNAITEAVQIFSKSPEGVRYIECLIEQGALYRDYMNHIKNEETAFAAGKYRLYRNRSVNALTKALKLAEGKNFPRHQLDALVDLAYTYYYAEDFEKAEDTIQIARLLVPPEVLLNRGKQVGEKPEPPDPNIAEPYIFMLLAKQYTLQGELRMDQFIARAEVLCEDVTDKQKRRCLVQKDDFASQWLRDAAEAYVLALGYSKLYSVRSPIFSVVMNSLYDYLRKFNETEMSDFYKYQREARLAYNVAEIKPIDMTDLEVFLLQAFGDYFELPPGLVEGN